MTWSDESRIVWWAGRLTFSNASLQGSVVSGGAGGVDWNAISGISDIIRGVDAAADPPDLPPEPVERVRALDLDDVAPVALPAQKGRAIDLE